MSRWRKVVSVVGWSGVVLASALGTYGAAVEGRPWGALVWLSMMAVAGLLVRSSVLS